MVKVNSSSKQSNVDKISFMRLIDESDDEDIDDLKLKPNLKDKRTPKLNSKASASNEDDDFVEEIDDINDFDYEMEMPSETSSLEYETDDEYDETRKKRFKRTCMDDGDEDLFLKRYKQLEKNEKRKQDELEEEDDDDLLEMVEDDDLDAEGNTQENTIVRINNQKHIELDAGLKVPESIWNRLYKFQKTGLKWLWELHMQRCGGILGDEMGLGKTIQIIAYFASLKYSKVRSVGFSYVGLGPVLIIAPVTLIGHWVKEVSNF